MNITQEGEWMSNIKKNKPEDGSLSNSKKKEELQDSTARIRRLSDYNKS